MNASGWATKSVLANKERGNKLKSFTLVHPGGQTTTNCMLNPQTVLRLQASREDQIGKTILSLIGDEIIGVTATPEDAMQILGVQLVKLQHHDRAGRPGFDFEVFVSPSNISLVTKSNVGSFYTLSFVDGTHVDVVDASPLFSLAK